VRPGQKSAASPKIMAAIPLKSSVHQLPTIVRLARFDRYNEDPSEAGAHAITARIVPGWAVPAPTPLTV
jgi:hypothetical protein